jgi:hypothetical protein
MLAARIMERDNIKAQFNCSTLLGVATVCDERFGSIPSKRKNQQHTDNCPGKDALRKALPNADCYRIKAFFIAATKNRAVIRREKFAKQKADATSKAREK